MTTTPLHSAVQVTNPADVLAAVPHLLGFTPENSLVLITLHGMDQTPQLGLTMRTDIPARRHYPALAEQLLRGPVTGHNAEAVMLIVVGHGPPEREGGTEPPESPAPPGSAATIDSIPHRGLVETLRGVFGEAGVPVVHAAWTREIRKDSSWACYDDEVCHGTLDDPTTSPLAAAMAAAGSITFSSRDELEKLVAPESAENLARRAARLDVICAELDERPSAGASISKDIEFVFGAIRRTAEGAALTEDDYIRVLIAVSDQRVRDLALGTALSARAEAAEQLWITLVRKAPPPELAEVASLLAFSAYIRGDGALAGVALDRIDSTRPDHRLGKLLRQALNAGLPPEKLTRIAYEAAEDARVLLAQEGVS